MQLNEHKYREQIGHALEAEQQEALLARVSKAKEELLRETGAQHEGNEPKR